MIGLDWSWRGAAANLDAMPHSPRVILCLLPLTLAGCGPKDPALSQSQVDHLAEGIAYLTEGDADTAIARFTAAIEAGQRLEEAHLQRGLAFLEKRQPRRAIADFSSVLSREPDHAEAHYRKGVAHNRLKETDQALAAFGNFSIRCV